MCNLKNKKINKRVYDCMRKNGILYERRQTRYQVHCARQRVSLVWRVCNTAGHSHGYRTRLRGAFIVASGCQWRPKGWRRYHKTSPAQVFSSFSFSSSSSSSSILLLQQLTLYFVLFSFLTLSFSLSIYFSTRKISRKPSVIDLIKKIYIRI